MRVQKEDYPYILKIIVLADIDIDVYKYIVKNPDILASVEKGNDIPAEDKNKWKLKEDKIEDAKKLLILPPHASEIKTDLAEIFYLVGLFEEPLPDPREFMNLAKTDSDKALQFIKEMPGNWIHFTKLILGSLSQSFENIKNEPTKSDDITFINPIKKEVETIKKFYLEFAKKENEEHKNLVESLLTLLPLLGANVSKVLNNNETEILNLALDFGTDEFWQQYLSTERFNDFNNFNQVISNLDEQKILESEIISPILSRVQSFIDPNLEGVINLIKSKKLFETKKSDEFQKKTVEYFSGQVEPTKRDQLFNLFKESKLSDESKITIISDFFTKNEYQKIKDLIAIDSFNQIIILQKLNDFQNFITKKADFNNSDCKELIKTIIVPANFARYRLIDSAFLQILGDKIKNVSDPDFKTEYAEMLLNNQLIDGIKKNKKGYFDMLDVIYTTATSNIKRKITNFKKKVNGDQNARRRTGRKTSTK